MAKFTDFDARLLGYIMQGVGIDRHTAPEVRTAFIISVGRLAIRHFRELDAVDPEQVIWNDEEIAIGGQADPKHRSLTGDRYRAHQRATYFVRRFGSMTRHIIDWLTVAVRDDHAWLRNVDDRGRPKKLLKSDSVMSLFQEAEKQLARVAQQQSAQVDTQSALTSRDVKWAARLGEDLHVVQLLSPEALDAESAVMAHCIGLGSYDSKVEGDERRWSYWSVRNSDGVPLATLEVREGIVVQLAGRGNGHASRAVQEAVESYMSQVGWAYTRPVEDFDDVGGRIRRGLEYHRLQARFGYPVTIDDIRLFHRLPSADQIIVVTTLKDAAGLPHDAEVPREWPDAVDVDPAPRRPR